jgi:protein gp37
LRKWNKQAGLMNETVRVFTQSMSDFFEDHPQLPPWRAEAFDAIEKSINLVVMLLTKRPENVLRMVPAHWLTNWPTHVWIGTSVENQQAADERIPHLLQIPAKVRFLSMEPLLGAVDLPVIESYLQPDGFGMNGPRIPQGIGYADDPDSLIQWVIVGGESGHGARPMHPHWAQSIRDQCVAAGVAFHFKQWGVWLPMSHMTQSTENTESATWAWPWANGNHGDLRGDTTMVVKVGKRAAGRLLDGRTWDEFPAVAS